MVGFECDRSNGYVCRAKLFNLSDVANFEKKFPKEWITAEGNNVTEDFAKYALPLIQGETKLREGRRPAPLRPPQEGFSRSNPSTPRKGSLIEGAFYLPIFSPINRIRKMSSARHHQDSVRRCKIPNGQIVTQ